MQSTRLRRFAGIAMIPIAFGAIVNAVAPSDEVTFAPARALAFAGLSTSVGFMLLALSSALLRRPALHATLALMGPRVPPAALLAYIAGALGISHLLDSLLRSTSGWSMSALGEFERIVASADSGDLALLVIGVALAPGIAEELLFRGSLLSLFRTRTGPAQSVLVTSLIFGALHVDPLHMAGAFVLGLYFGAMTVRTGSLRSALLCHIANNLVAISTAKNPLVELGSTPSVGIAISCIAALAGLFALLRPLRTRGATHHQQGAALTVDPRD